MKPSGMKVTKSFPMTLRRLENYLNMHKGKTFNKTKLMRGAMLNTSPQMIQGNKILESWVENGTIKFLGKYGNGYYYEIPHDFKINYPKPYLLWNYKKLLEEYEYLLKEVEKLKSPSFTQEKETSE